MSGALWRVVLFMGVGGLAVVPTVQAQTGNSDNPVYTFRLGRIGIASTAIYSIDRSLFQLAAPGATDRRVVRPGLVVALAQDGSPTPS